MLRLSDEEETRVSLGLAGPEGLQKRRSSTRYLSLRRRQGGCLMICGWEGETESVRRRRALSQARLRARRRRLRSGQAAGRSWERGRYGGPYLRDELMEHGGDGGDARDRPHLEQAGRALRGRGRRAPRRARGEGRPIVMCHVSHAYPDGASLYFTFFARARRGRGARAVAGGQARRLRGDRRHRGHDHPPPRGRPRPRPLHARPRSASWASTRSAPSRSASTRPGS